MFPLFAIDGLSMLRSLPPSGRRSSQFHWQCRTESLNLCTSINTVFLHDSMAMTKGQTGKPRKNSASRSASKQTPLERYITMLETIAASGDANLSDLAGLCHLPFSSAHRVLHTLLHTRLVLPANGQRGGYRLGPRLMRLLHTGLDEAWLRITGQQIIDELALQLNDTCFINKLIGKEVVTIAWAAPENRARGYLVPGITQPLHASASAKAILAYQPAPLIRKLLPARLPKLCTETKGTTKAVIADLESVRARGYATCWNEYEKGVAAVACPVLLSDAEVVYSVGVTGLIDRLSAQPIEKVVSTIRYAAECIARAVQHADKTNSIIQSEIAATLPSASGKARSQRLARRQTA